MTISLDSPAGGCIIDYMASQSTDQYDASGRLVNGFDYDLQVWVKDGLIQACAHPTSMGPACCNGRAYAGLALAPVLEGRATMSGSPTRRYPARVSRSDW